MSKLRWECSSFWLPISFRLSQVRPGGQANTQTLLHDQKNPTHHISGACSPHSPLYRSATHMFPLLTICAWCVRLWREVIWGGQGCVTSARRAWPDTGDFSSHGRLLSCSTGWHLLMSHTEEKFSALPAEDNSSSSPSQTGSYDHYIRGKLNFHWAQEREQLPGVASSFPATCGVCSFTVPFPSCAAKQ